MASAFQIAGAEWLFLFLGLCLYRRCRRLIRFSTLSEKRSCYQRNTYGRNNKTDDISHSNPF